MSSSPFNNGGSLDNPKLFSLSPTRTRSQSFRMPKDTYSLFPPTPQEMTFEAHEVRPRQDSSTLPVHAVSLEPDWPRPPCSPRAHPPRSDSRQPIRDSTQAPIPVESELELVPPPRNPLRTQRPQSPLDHKAPIVQHTHQPEPPQVNIGLFARFTATEPKTILIQPSSTTSVLGHQKAHVFLGNHTVFLGDRPLFQWVQGLFSRRTIQCVQLNGASLCTLKRARARHGLGRAALHDAAGRELALLKWAEQTRAGVELDCALWANLVAPADAPRELASPALALRRVGPRGVEYALVHAGRAVATFARLPVAGDALEVRVEAGMDVCFVSAVAIAAAYAVRDLYLAVCSRAAHGQQRVESYLDQLLLEAQRP